MHLCQLDQEIKMLKHESSEMNPRMFLFVNPYEINPGNFRMQNHIDSSTTQTPPTLVKTSFGSVSTCELEQPNPTRKAKVEMEEFSNLGELIPSLREKCLMDEYDLKRDEAENINDVSLQLYESQSLEEFVDTQGPHAYENHQLYIDNTEHINLDDINENDLHILQQELSSDCANSDLKVHDYNDSINNSNLVNKISNIYQLEVNTRTFNFRSDHSYSNVSSPSNSSCTSEFSPMDIVKPLRYGENKEQLNEETMDSNSGVKLFVEDTLNTPEILECVVSLEDERFNFLNYLSNENLQTINEDELAFEPALSSQIKEECQIIKPEALTKKSRKRKKYDSDDDYVPPTTTRSRKKATKIIETNSESDDDYVSVRNLKLCKERSKRISLSSDSSKDSNGVSTYRELRNKNNESSRKSRLKRRVKEQEMELEAQELENKNVKLKTEVEELQRVVDNFRSNLFQIMMKK